MHDRLAKLEKENERYRKALEEIVRGLSEKGPRVIAEEALASIERKLTENKK